MWLPAAKQCRAYVPCAELLTYPLIGLRHDHKTITAGTVFTDWLRSDQICFWRVFPLRPDIHQAEPIVRLRGIRILEPIPVHISPKSIKYAARAIFCSPVRDTSPRTSCSLSHHLRRLPPIAPASKSWGGRGGGNGMLSCTAYKKPEIKFAMCKAGTQ